MFFNNKCNTFFGLNLTLVYTFPMCMAWRFHFPIRNYDFNISDLSCHEDTARYRPYCILIARVSPCTDCLRIVTRNTTIPSRNNARNQIVPSANRRLSQIHVCTDPTQREGGKYFLRTFRVPATNVYRPNDPSSVNHPINYCFL